METKHRISIPKYTLGEELMNSITHGIGAGLGIAALVLCVVKSCRPLDGYKLASSIVFGLTTTLLYLMSCLYHALKVNRAKRVFRVIDHCTIFLLIAGTYTPYTLITLRGTVGWVLFGVVWGVGILGIVLNAVNLRRYAKVSVACYIMLGWVVLFSIKQLVAALAPTGLWLLLSGGIAYTVGAILYGIGAKKRYFHSVFHFFCLLGTALHFFSIYLYVL
ncbi:MAG: hemolysin III family protein [Clostridiales bacterium]|nr:hemolysin III family protein [Clostridiales bacterium]